MFVLEDWTGLQGEERSMNEAFIEEAWEVISKENIRIFNNMEEGGPSRSAKGEKDIQEKM
jgi:hypothetical protein